MNSIRQKNMIRVLFLFIMLVGIPISTNAYVPGADQILGQFLNSQGSAKTIEVKQKFTQFDKRIKTGSAEFTEIVRYKFPDKYRSVIAGSKVKKIIIINAGRTLGLLDDKIIPINDHGFDHSMDFFIYKNKDMFHRVLDFNGIELSQTSYDKLGDRIVFVVGRRGDDESVIDPTLSIDKKTLYPVRWLLGSSTKSDTGEGGGPMEILYLDWKKYGSCHYPSRIEFYNNHVMIRKVNVISVTCDVKLDDAMFDIDTVRRKYSSRTVSTYARPNRDDKNDSQKTIDRLDKIIRKDQLAY